MLKIGDKVKIPTKKYGLKIKSQDLSELDDYNLKYLVINNEGNLTDNVGLSRDDRGRFDNNSFYMRDLELYEEQQTINNYEVF